MYEQKFGFSEKKEFRIYYDSLIFGIDNTGFENNNQEKNTKNLNSSSDSMNSMNFSNNNIVN